MKFDYFSKNGKVLPISEATVSLMSVEYTYGFGVYETIRVNNKKPMFLDDHIERLIKSAEIIRLEHLLTHADIKKQVEDIVSATVEPTYNMKMLLIGAPKPEDVNFYIFLSCPLFPDRKLYRDGVKTTTTMYERIYPQSKTLNMLQSYLSYRDAKSKDCYDSLLINRHGNITEGTRTNFFTIKGNTIYSPFEKDLLLGVTRKYIIDVAKESGFNVEEKDIHISTLGDYDGAFLTSTSTKIVPIKRIDDFEYQSIPETIGKLITAFDDFLKKQ